MDGTRTLAVRRGGPLTRSRIPILRIPFLLGLSVTLAPSLWAQAIQPPFSESFEIVDIGPLVGVSGNLGGITLRHDEPDHVYLLGGAGGPAGAVYRVPILREKGHIASFAT